MKPLLLCLALSLTGCATELFDPQTGKRVATFRSDITAGEYSAGGTHLAFSKMSNSLTTRAALLGTKRIVDSVGTIAAQFATPGSGTVPVITRATTAVVPHLTNGKPGDN